MFEDGVYVSYFSDDEDKKSAPKSVVIIENGKIQILFNPATPDDTAKFLTSLAKAFAEAVSEDEKDFAVARLGRYWEGNMYFPNPSDFFELDSDGAKRFIELSENWTSKQDNTTEHQLWEGQEPTHQNMKANGYDIHPNADLRKADLSNADLSNANLAFAKLVGANLFDADLPGANLSNADLSNANLASAKLQDANLSGANLRCANLSNADLSNANLSDANLMGVNLVDADLPGANLSNANLWGANLFAARLQEVNLGGARLDGVHLAFTGLNYANLRGAMVDSNLTEATLSQAVLTGATMPDGSIHK